GESGPIVRSLVWRAAAPGTTGIETEVILVDGLPRIEIIARLDKRLVYDPEAVLYRFAFAGDPASVRISVPGGAATLEEEQLPGANRNYFSARSWIQLRDGSSATAHTVTLVMLDVPVLQIGALGSDPIVTGWRTQVQPSGTVWSYVMNNYWETNYRAGQQGRVAFRYVVAPDADPETAARALTRPLIVVP
ncbi:MAG: hypothetical protein OEW06_01165, partial [Gemmatimonadota bacterium]|nr:hypothetical protein [Gemmatimonadota bacterium]